MFENALLRNTKSYTLFEIFANLLLCFTNDFFPLNDTDMFVCDKRSGESFVFLGLHLAMQNHSAVLELENKKCKQIY